MFHDNALRTSLIFGVFATNNAAGGLHASFERHFVKKIQHLFEEETHLSLSTFFCPTRGLVFVPSIEKERGYTAP